jgi:hypothetical protein
MYFLMMLIALASMSLQLCAQVEMLLLSAQLDALSEQRFDPETAKLIENLWSGARSAILRDVDQEPVLNAQFQLLKRAKEKGVDAELIATDPNAINVLCDGFEKAVKKMFESYEDLVKNNKIQEELYGDIWQRAMDKALGELYKDGIEIWFDIAKNVADKTGVQKSWESVQRTSQKVKERVDKLLDELKRSYKISENVYQDYQLRSNDKSTTLNNYLTIKLEQRYKGSKKVGKSSAVIDLPKYAENQKNAIELGFKTLKSPSAALALKLQSFDKVIQDILSTLRIVRMQEPDMDSEKWREFLKNTLESWYQNGFLPLANTLRQSKYNESQIKKFSQSVSYFFSTLIKEYQFIDLMEEYQARINL